MKFWTLFGASNQLLAALIFLAISVWLHRARQRIAFTLVSMAFVLTITLWAFGKLVVVNLAASKGFDVELVNALLAAVLVVLAMFVVASAAMWLRTERWAPALLGA